MQIEMASPLLRPWGGSTPWRPPLFACAGRLSTCVRAPLFRLATCWPLQQWSPRDSAVTAGAPTRTSQFWRAFSSEGGHWGPRGRARTNRQNLASQPRLGVIRTENSGQLSSSDSAVTTGAPALTSQFWRAFSSKGGTGAPGGGRAGKLRQNLASPPRLDKLGSGAFNYIYV